ncbi:MAG: hypothetical protein BECKG1743F_GA0114225_103213 [Candidatus Kentron sp. G]|nr:MAG: hypothetical protein BECKG1743F_GA0114225_103213 [Candidatus Kentron sp. G]
MAFHQMSTRPSELGGRITFSLRGELQLLGIRANTRFAPYHEHDEIVGANLVAPSVAPRTFAHPISDND